MTFVREDFTRYSRPAAHCRYCGQSLGGLLLRDGDFECRRPGLYCRMEREGERSPLGTFAECPQCGGPMRPEHAHYRCTDCGWRDSCCDRKGS